MICSICGCEYQGKFCPICHSADKIEQRKNDFSQFDYFPRRAQIRQMTFSASFNPQNPKTGSWSSNASAPQQKQKIGGQNSFAGGDTSSFQSNTGSPSGGYRFCPKCGNVLRGTFCSQCGYNSGVNPSSGWHGTGNNDIFHQNKAQPKAKGWVIGLVIAIAVILFVILPIVLVVVWGMLIVWSVEQTDSDARNWLDDSSPFYDYDNKDGELNPEDYDDFEDYLRDYLNEKGLDPESSQPQDSKELIPEDEGTSILPSGVSNAEYKQLEIGMTYSQISAIIGGDGSVTGQEGDSFTAVWMGEYKPQAVVTITFENGAAVSINQNGLFETNE